MRNAWVACVVSGVLVAGCGGRLAGEEEGDGAAGDAAVLEGGVGDGEVGDSGVVDASVDQTIDGDRDGGDSGQDARADAGDGEAHDATRDGGHDAARDGGRDGGHDAGHDGGFDSGRDAGVDSGHDGGFDSGRDGGFDSGHDGGIDSGHDGGFDSGHDGGFDAGHDSGHDAGHDTGTDGGCSPACDPELGLGLACVAGVCTGDCAASSTSNVGCEYYAVTMANDQLSQSTFGFYLVVVNGGASSATLTITGGGLATADAVVVAAGSVQNIALPWVSSLSMSQATTLASGGAYHIKSTEPVAAYEFNGKDELSGGTQSYTNDASLLLPIDTLTGNYVVAAWPSWSYAGGANYAGTIAIVGTVTGTTVTVTPPSAAFQAGAGLTSSGGTITLNAGDVLQIGTALDAKKKSYGTDPSGTTITASAPVEVFGGSDCTAIPTGASACDHMEEVQPPLESLGSDYLVTLPDNSGGTPEMEVRIIGTASSGTTLTYDPPTGYLTAPATTLGLGEVTDFRTDQSFRVTATNPIVVAEYMESGSNFGGSKAAGDPSMSMAVPTAAYLDGYAFVAAPDWKQAWVSVIAPSGASVTVTDEPTDQTVSSGTTIGSSGYYLAYVALCTKSTSGCTGYHTASSASAFGLQVYSYGQYTSVMFPGGMSTAP